MSVRIADNGDGTGINVYVDDEAVDTVVSAEIRDTTQANYRAAGEITGNGFFLIPAIDGDSGTTEDKVTFSRSYWVRITRTIAGVPTLEAPVLVTPTVGYKSDVFSLILAIKHRLITVGVERIGGKVYHCIDPNGATLVAPDMPAAFVCQANPEGPQEAGDNDTYLLQCPIEIVFADYADADWIKPLQWWLYLRQWVYEYFHGFAVNDALGVAHASGQRFRVEAGPIPRMPDDQTKYKYRSQSMILRTTLERPIGG